MICKAVKYFLYEIYVERSNDNFINVALAIFFGTQISISGSFISIYKPIIRAM